jgi:catechol 2,3-dioxygenase-like lactoylglutathione lyase family enzyme
VSDGFQVSAIGQIHIGVKDIQRAVAFYRDVLGMPLLFESFTAHPNTTSG